MFRILVVDDEPIVIQSIFHIIKTDIDPAIEIEKARNGREAIETAWKFRPDIVVTDIKMPGINGLDVIGEIKSQLAGTRFIILSAYEQFTFAKEAVALGVDEYLLKPVSRTRMAESIKKTISRIENDRTKMTRDLLMKEKMEKMLPSIESSFLLSVLFFDDFDFDAGRELLELKSESGLILVAELRPDGNDGAHALNRPFGEVCNDILKQYEGSLTCPLSALKTAAFLPATDDEKGREYAKSAAHSLIEKASVKNAFVAVGVGGVCRDLKSLKESYGEALVALSHIKKNGGAGAALYFSEIERRQPADAVLAEKKKTLFARVAMGDFAGSWNCFEEVFNGYRGSCGQDFNRLKEKTAELMAMMVVKAYDAEVPENEDAIAPVLHAAGLPELVELCRAKMLELCLYMESASKGRVCELIGRANEIIDRGYANELTLECIAKELNIAPSYFSRLYKQQTGYNFIDYLIKVRIDHAKYLFLNTGLSVKEISYMTGYIDPNYFSRMFKKATGMTPTQFKSCAVAGKR